MSRKEYRKQYRLARKQNKADFFAAGTVRNKRRVKEDCIESPQRKRGKYDGSRLAVDSQALRSPLKFGGVPQPLTSGAKSLETGGSVKHSISTRNNVFLPQKENDEDLYIAYLESRLKSRVREDDGLDGKYNAILLFELHMSVTTFHRLIGSS